MTLDLNKPGMSFTVPLVPVTVNSYVRHTRNGRHYVTKEAIAFKGAVSVFANHHSVAGKKHTYALDVTVFLGKGKRGDGDNFWKCIGDGLVEAGVIHSDAAVKHWNMQVKRDWDNPRTEISVQVL